MMNVINVHAQDEDEGDMYEAPPFERAAIKVSTQPGDMDLIYLGIQITL